MDRARAGPLADATRERTARGLFPYEQVEPEEWAARHAHEIRWFTFHRYRYRDPGLHRWLAELGQVLEDPVRLEAARRRHLSHSERVAIATGPATNRTTATRVGI